MYLTLTFCQKEMLMENQKNISSFEKLLARPANVIFLSFLSVILIGTLMLLLPAASKSSDATDFIDALFTATSATCVTGLIVFDTATKWSLFGQIVILLLIQIGGLGLITLATFFTSILGKKIGLKGRIVAQEQISHISFTGVLDLIKKVVIITLAAEAIGTIALSFSFVPEYGTRGIYVSFFHAVSAFCNAGFDIMGNFTSLTAYSSNWLVVLTVAALIIFGGLGFMVWQDVYSSRKLKNMLLHTKMVAAMTVILLFAGTVFFFLFERSNASTLGPLSLQNKLLNSFFMSVTTRTAGFNTIDINDMSEISKIFTCLFMFIGAAPGSTAGGVKVTTIAILLAVMMSQIRGRQETLVFGKRIIQPVIMKALTIVGLSSLWVIITTTVILGIEGGNFINVLYEVTSAFGTVGLSTGMTPSLSLIPKILIILTMFFGRIGPLTFAISMTLKSAGYDNKMIRPEGKVAVG